MCDIQITIKKKNRTEIWTLGVTDSDILSPKASRKKNHCF